MKYNMNNDKALYTVAEAAEMMHTDKQTVYGLIKDRKLRTIKFGVFKIRAEELSNFFKSANTCSVTGGEC